MIGTDILLPAGLLTLSAFAGLVYALNRTRRQLAEQVGSEQRWKLALEGAGDGVWDWNLETGEVVFSKNWKAMLGYAEEEIGTHVSEWESRVHPDDKATVMADVQAYLAGQNPVYANEHRMLCKDGGWKWILDRGMVVANRNGKPLRMVGTHTDISRHKQLEQALLEQEEELQTIFAQSPDGIVVLDQSHSVAHVNQAFSRITGFSGNDLIGRAETEFDAMMQTLCPENVIYPGTAVRPQVAAENIALRAQSGLRRRSSDRGVHIDILNPEQRVLLRSVIDLDRRRLSRVLYFRDVTAEVLVDRMRTEFLSTAAHELRTPMSIILGYAELLKMRTFDKSTETRMVDSIHDQSQSIVTLLNELLDLARIEARAGKAFNIRKQPLSGRIEHLAESFIMPGDPRKVGLMPLPALPDLWFDSEKLDQAIKNCLSNAFKFSSPERPVTLEVTLNGEGSGQEVVIMVRDEGIGMKAEQLARIFEKFYRVDTSGKIPGTGLGMSLVKEIIEHHGGRVVVESEFGRGTTVSLRLPVHEVEMET